MPVHATTLTHDDRDRSRETASGHAPAPSTAASDLVYVGRILGARGVRGEVRVRSHTGDPKAIGSYGPLFAHDRQRSFRMTVTGQGSGAHAGTVFARLAGITDRDAAEALKGVDLFVPRTTLPAPDTDEFYHADLVGMAAARSDGAELGTVVAVHNFGAGDVLEIGAGSRTVLVPFTSTAVPVIDLTARRVTVEPLPGLFDAAEKEPASEKKPGAARHDKPGRHKAGRHKAGASR